VGECCLLIHRPKMGFCQEKLGRRSSADYGISSREAVCRPNKQIRLRGLNVKVSRRLGREEWRGVRLRFVSHQTGSLLFDFNRGSDVGACRCNRRLKTPRPLPLLTGLDFFPHRLQPCPLARHPEGAGPITIHAIRTISIGR